MGLLWQCEDVLTIYNARCANLRELTVFLPSALKYAIKLTVFPSFHFSIFIVVLFPRVLLSSAESRSSYLGRLLFFQRLVFISGHFLQTFSCCHFGHFLKS